MKKTKKITLIVVLAGVLTLSICAGVFIVNAVGTSKDTSATTATTTASDDEIAKEFEEINKYYDQQEKEQTENDLLALTIMRKYQKTTESEIIMDKQTDCDLMRVMCDMINNNEFAEDEIPVIKKYLEGRVAMLNVPVDSPILEGESELERSIYVILGWDTQYLDAQQQAINQ